MSDSDLNPFGTVARIVLLGVTVAAAIVYALAGENLAALPIVAVVALLYVASFRGIRRFVESLFARRR
ncbi:MAG TPA: hypothetical protein VFT10_05180 [Solirubrobacterales bacterium]|nr:hypothetical protein [Solirubrobacterales bacterium]